MKGTAVRKSKAWVIVPVKENGGTVIETYPLCQCEECKWYRPTGEGTGRCKLFPGFALIPSFFCANGEK